MNPSALVKGVVCFLTAALLAGCTDRRGADGTASTPTPTVVGSEPVPSGPVPVFTEDDAVLNVAVPEPSTLDPMRLRDPGSVLVARQLYEGLTRWDPARERVRPAAAESWRVAGGGRTFRFKLREGMTFHDGSPVRSKDFKFA